MEALRIPRAEALAWFRFFAELPEDESLSPRQEELALAVIAQIEDAVDARFEALAAEVPGLKSFEGRSLYVGDEKTFPGGCRSCLTGTGLSAVRRTNRCNLRCPFCYDYGCLDQQPPIGEGLWEIGGTRFRERDLDLLLRTSCRPTGIAYVYLEPFCEIEKYYGVIRRFHEAGVYQHMYTNGTLATAENLRALGESGLDELRFNLGATDCAPKVIGAIAEAKRFIPRVGIETPMTPAFLTAFEARKAEVLSTGVDFINCAELHLNPNNAANYEGEPMYLHRLGYLSPVWSREITFRLMREAAEEGWPCLVHDCSNHTKFARGLHQRAAEGAWFGASAWEMEFPALPFRQLIPILESPDWPFLEEKPMPPGYRLTDIII
ncbi:MAG: radical SAM protein [Clostridia bacterium]|nr:radical SAM protein [Clostridia bacterium]